MKSKTKIVSSLLILLILVIITTNNLANPVLITYFSELYFDFTGWKLELHKNFYDYETTQLKGCLLTSLNDSAYIKSDIILDSNYVVLTKEDLTKNLTINPLGDKISLYLKRDNEFYYFDELEFGDSLSWPIPPAPKQNYSLCVTNNYNWYLDNSPTIGFPNDTVGACGKLKGIIKDSLGNAISNVRIYYDRNGTELIFSKYIFTNFRQIISGKHERCFF